MWAAYGTVEVLLAVFVGGMTFMTRSVPPGWPYTLFLLLLYPLAGALLGRFAVAGLAAAFAANAVATIVGTALAVPLASAVVAVALFRRSPWMASLLLVLPLWGVRELGATWPFRTKLLLTGSLFVAVTLLGLLAARRRWTLQPRVTIAIFALTMLVSALPRTAAQRDLPPEAPPPRVASPNIVLIVMDTVRADHLSVYGYRRNTTPELARFARTATLYTRAYAPSNMTLPSHASLFTGLYASEHTAHFDDGWPFGRPLPARALTLAELLSARGYATASIVANGYLGEGFGLDQGFQHLDARAPEMPYGIAAAFYLRTRIAEVASLVVESSRVAQRHARGGDQISDLAIAYLDRVAPRRRPFFLLLNYLDAHHPYLPPPPYDTMFPGYDASQPADLSRRLLASYSRGEPKITARERAHLISQYDGSIAYEDRQIARVFAALQRHRIYDRTLIVVVSDHGESFGEHGTLTHGFTTYDAETHVPLIVREPGQSAGAVVTRPVSLLEVWPLLTGVPPAPFAVITESLPLRGARAALPSQRSGRAKIEGTIKTIVNANGTIETYDLATDPAELRNLAPNAASARMAAELAQWQRSLRSVESTEPPRAIDPETIRRLRALGYLR